ncbi:hypothetical protein PACTADRAFT_185871 [Pachysolen tannophilus NRRL Y-2460]|uniref:Arginase n=1 Tax=Pachysolen tannophilus NRRL Y-2460 TaxID=669874 RepID=A0A1E4U1E9_PACTA|nr:hypothetical protein PACTADRAFT_185871 [Pachysolen tannophilus NRRL Y-2460]
MQTSICFVDSYKFHPSRKITLILAPFDGGQPKSGVEEGPQHLLDAGLQSQLEELGWTTSIDEPLKDLDLLGLKKDASDVHGIVKRPNMVSLASQRIHDAVKTAALKNTLPLTIGGDHSIAIGTVSGFFEAQPDACLLWIDAHADINTISTTESGNLHGCPVSFVMGLDKESWPPHFKWLRPNLRADRIAYIGLRDVDKGEKKILKDLGITAFSMYHVDKYGIGKVVEMALKAINPENNRPVHVSYDVDAIDPLFVQATGTPVKDGLTLREGLFIVEEVAATGNLAALDVVETNPSLALNETHVLDTVRVGCAIARCALGETLL